jgi:hypothetical protein
LHLPLHTINVNFLSESDSDPFDVGTSEEDDVYTSEQDDYISESEEGKCFDIYV